MPVENVPRSYLAWMIESLGVYAIILPFLGMLLFGVSCIVVALSKRPAVIAACLVLVPLPFIIGVFAFLNGAISAFQVIANSETAPAPRDVASGIASGLFAPLMAIEVTLPGYLVLAFGLLWRTIASGRGTARPPEVR